MHLDVHPAIGRTPDASGPGRSSELMVVAESAGQWVNDRRWTGPHPPRSRFAAGVNRQATVRSFPIIAYARIGCKITLTGGMRQPSVRDANTHPDAIAPPAEDGRSRACVGRSGEDNAPFAAACGADRSERSPEIGAASALSAHRAGPGGAGRPRPAAPAISPATRRQHRVHQESQEAARPSRHMLTVASTTARRPVEPSGRYHSCTELIMPNSSRLTSRGSTSSRI